MPLELQNVGQLDLGDHARSTAGGFDSPGPSGTGEQSVPRCDNDDDHHHNDDNDNDDNVSRCFAMIRANVRCRQLHVILLIITALCTAWNLLGYVVTIANRPSYQYGRLYTGAGHVATAYVALIGLAATIAYCSGRWKSLVRPSMMWFAAGLTSVQVILAGAFGDMSVTGLTDHANLGLIGTLVFCALGFSWRHGSRDDHSKSCECGYDLTGNQSGICPECGRAVRQIASCNGRGSGVSQHANPRRG